MGSEVIMPCLVNVPFCVRIDTLSDPKGRQPRCSAVGFHRLAAPRSPQRRRLYAVSWLAIGPPGDRSISREGIQLPERGLRRGAESCMATAVNTVGAEQEADSDVLPADYRPGADEPFMGPRQT